MQTFNEYRVVKKEACSCNAEDYTWDGEPISLDEVQTGSIYFSGIAFSALTGTLPYYIAYKIMQKRLAKAMAGCTDQDTILLRNKCLYDFRKKKAENTIKLLSKAKGKTKDPDKLKKIGKEIDKVKEKMGELRANF